MSDKQPKEFSKWRGLFWPIHNFEMKKFLPMAMILFFILFNYTVLRDTKDVLVVNASGSHVLAFLKFYCVLPSAILFVIIYNKLCNAFEKEKVFYILVSFFLIFFGAFGFFLYPNVELFHPTAEAVKNLHESYPRLGGFIDVYAHWTFSLFYVMAEIWGSAMISLLFWQFANQITRMNEAKRFYGLFAVIANISLIFAGTIENFVNNIHNYFDVGGKDWILSLQILMAIVVCSGIACMYLFKWMHANVLTDPLYYDEAEQTGKPKKKKPKLSISESAKIIFTSPELGLIALLVISYGISINLVEVQWKNQLKLFYAGDKNGYHAFMGTYSSFVGIFTIIFILGIGANILRSLSWFKSAIITPALTLICGSVFFMFILGKDSFAPMLAEMSITPIAMAAFLGAALVMLSKAVKYSLFDPTKEMAYIPLDDTLKTRGKAAVDVIGGRLGKAGGAVIQSTLTLLLVTKDVLTFAPITAGIFIIICLLWLVAVKKLSIRVNAASRKQKEHKA